MSDTTSITTPPSSAPPTSWWQRVTLRQIALGTMVVALVLLGLLLVITLRNVLILLFLGVVVATALTPIVDRLRRLGLSQSIAALIAFALLLALVAAIVTALAPFIATQIVQVVGDLPERYASLRGALTTSSSTLVRNLAAQMPADPFKNASGADGFTVGATLAVALPSLGRALLFSALVLSLSYYWLCYRALAIQALALLAPLNKRAEAIDLWNQIEAKIGAFVRGLAALSATIAIMSGIGYTLIGLPYGITIALIGGLLEAIPYVGPFVTMALAVTVGLSVSPTMGALAALVAVIVQFTESSVIVPRVMDRAVGVRPVVTLLALTIFELLFGLIGALLAVPLAAVFQVLIDRFVMSGPSPEQQEIGGRDKLALLRYQTQDLARDLRQQVRVKTDEIDDASDAVEEELEALLLDLDGLLAAAQEQGAS